MGQVLKPWWPEALTSARPGPPGVGMGVDTRCRLRRNAFLIFCSTYTHKEGPTLRTTQT